MEIKVKLFSWRKKKQTNILDSSFLSPTPRILLYPWLWFPTWYFIVFFLQFLQKSPYQRIRSNDGKRLRDDVTSFSDVLVILKKAKNSFAVVHGEPSLSLWWDCCVCSPSGRKCPSVPSQHTQVGLDATLLIICAFGLKIILALTWGGSFPEFLFLLLLQYCCISQIFLFSKCVTVVTLLSFSIEINL